MRAWDYVIIANVWLAASALASNSSLRWSAAFLGVFNFAVAAVAVLRRKP